MSCLRQLIFLVTFNMLMSSTLFYSTLTCALLVTVRLPAQNIPGLEMQLNSTAEECNKALASITIKGLIPTDSVAIHWSTGERNTAQITQVTAGDHNVSLYIKRKQNNTVLIKDTLIYFTVLKEECPIVIPKYFSPNDDQYNDVMNIGNLDRYPDFELEVFNKLGQRVHHQRRAYTPWDGKWLGVNLPDGTYYVFVFPDANNRSKVYKGDVTILR